MPSTVNGIGTSYRGRKNRTSRTAMCKSCQRVGNLESYDTRLWFVVVFIPIIPLGRKRIIDKCPACTRHYVLKADVYEQTKQLQTSGSLERFRREPSPDSALEAHGQLLGFHEREQAGEFRQAALARFPDHAVLRAGMAAQLAEMSSFEESAKLFQDAFDLAPELPEARVGVARRKMAEGDLDEARGLLDFLMEPGAGQQYSLQPIDTLSGSFQLAGRHEEALEIAGVLLRELPKVVDHHEFRTFVKRSEKALARTESILPKRGFSPAGLFRSEGSPYAPWQRKMAIGGIAAALLLVGLAINNEYIRRHRTLHVLNATGQPAQVQMDGQPPATLNGMGHLTVPEGAHVVKVSGPVNETHNIALDSGYLERWTSNPAWVLNLGGEGVLQEITHVYSAQGSPGRRQLLVGNTFFHRPHIDYVFTDAPAQIKLGKGNKEVTKTELGWTQAEDSQAFMETIRADRKAGMDFAEKRLRRNPNQPELLGQYIGGARDDERGRVESFLKSGIDRRPVDIPWHRAYQTIAEVKQHDAELISIYDKFLAAEPSNAPLIYLRGRADPDWASQEAYYRRAIEADPKLGWPWMAIAVRAGSAGNWDGALQAADKAKALNLNEPQRIAEIIHEARMAKGEAKALVDQYRAGLGANLQDFSPILFLIDALAASGRQGEIDPAITAWVNRLPGQVRGQIIPFLRAMGLYGAGKLKECVDFCNSSGPAKSSLWHLHSLLALGRTEEATDESVFRNLWDDPMNLLAVSVGLGLDGKPEDAERWREKASSKLKAVAKASQLLDASAPPSIEEVHQVFLPSAGKAILLASLADRFPANRQIYLAESERFNITRKPPYHLILRAIEKKATGRP